MVGTVPPPGGGVARAFAEHVAERVAAGDEIEILSPDPRSAAHHTANLAQWRLPVRLAVLSSKFDALELRLEPGLPFADRSSRFMRAVTLFGLGVVFGLYAEVTIRVDSPIPLPGGVGGRATTDFWRRASKVVVADAEDYRRICAAPGVDVERVEIATVVDHHAAARDRTWPRSTAEDVRFEALHEIRERAAAERRANGARVHLGTDGVGPLATSAFSANERVNPSGVSLARAVVRRVVREIAQRTSSAR